MSTPSEVAALVTAVNNLTQTVLNTRNEITNTVNNKIAELNAWKAALTPDSISAEPRYVSTIDLTGLSTNRYYPVWWKNPLNPWNNRLITIARYYSDDYQLNPFNTGGVQIAGLLLELEGAAHNSSSDTRILQVKRLSQTLRKTVRLIRFRMHCASVLPVPGVPLGPHITDARSHSHSGLYLRGGLSYKFFSNFHGVPQQWANPVMNYSREDGEVEMWRYKDTANNHGGRWMVKSYDINDPFLGDEYDDFVTPYNAFPYDIS